MTVHDEDDDGDVYGALLKATARNLHNHIHNGQPCTHPHHCPAAKLCTRVTNEAAEGIEDLRQATASAGNTLLSIHERLIRLEDQASRTRSRLDAIEGGAPLSIELRLLLQDMRPIAEWVSQTAQSKAFRDEAFVITGKIDRLLDENAVAEGTDTTKLPFKKDGP